MILAILKKSLSLQRYSSGLDERGARAFEKTWWVTLIRLGVYSPASSEATLFLPLLFSAGSRLHVGA